MNGRICVGDEVVQVNQQNVVSPRYMCTAVWIDGI